MLADPTNSIDTSHRKLPAPLNRSLTKCVHLAAGGWSKVAAHVHALHFKGGSVKPWQLLGRGYSIKTCNKLKNGLPIVRRPAPPSTVARSGQRDHEREWTPLDLSDEVSWDSDARQCQLQRSDLVVRWSPPLPRLVPQQSDGGEPSLRKANQTARTITALSWVLNAASRIPRECCDLQTVLASHWYRIQRGDGSNRWANV